uniref:Uncharacterized protein n=1 Tax=Amphimedon queenslandica TaxID=400682 RepID=A0A1X7U9K0_AMPQE
MWQWCLERKLTIHAIHIPGSQNLVADSQSRRGVKYSDWMLDPEIFTTVAEKWGLPNVDLFAAHHNAQLSRFYSYHLDLGAEGIVALSQCWKKLTCYDFPTFIFLGQVLQKLSQDSVKTAIIIALYWPAQPPGSNEFGDRPLIQDNDEVNDDNEVAGGELDIIFEDSIKDNDHNDSQVIIAHNFVSAIQRSCVYLSTLH